MSEFPQFKAGTPMPRSAASWNALVDAARSARKEPKNVMSVRPGARHDPATILVRNDSGSDVAQFGVLGLGDVGITEATNESEFKGQVYMAGETPAAGTHEGKIAVALEPIPIDGIGKCVVTGLVQCQVEMNAEHHTFADIKDASITQLSSTPSGSAEIMWSAGTTGVQWCIVHLRATRPIVFRAKITASSAISDDHSFEEIEADGTSVTGGFQATDAEEENKRRGVPTDTVVQMMRFPSDTVGGDPIYRFNISQGEKDGGAPKDLVPNTESDTDTREWDVEDQGGDRGYLYRATRVYVENDLFAAFARDVEYDATGNDVKVELETKYSLVGDAGLTSLDGHITLRPFNGGGANDLKVALNEPQADLNTLVLIPGTGIEFTEAKDGGAAGLVSQVDVEVDDSGRLLLANEQSDHTITISATGGGGAADGQGYEIVEVNDVEVLAKTDGGIINFKDKASPTAGHAAVEFGGSAADPQVDVEGEVDIDGYLKGLPNYDGTKDQFLVNNSGTLRWRNSKECGA